MGLKTPGGKRKDPEKYEKWKADYYSRPEVKAAVIRRENKYKENPENRPKILARHEVKNALRSGRMTRLPCEKCGACPTEAHHEDYSRPLDVRWLCEPHHTEEHRRGS